MGSNHRPLDWQSGDLPRDHRSPQDGLKISATCFLANLLSYDIRSTCKLPKLTNRLRQMKQCIIVKLQRIKSSHLTWNHVNQSSQCGRRYCVLNCVWLSFIRSIHRSFFSQKTIVSGFFMGRFDSTKILLSKKELFYGSCQRQLFRHRLLFACCRPCHDALYLNTW